MSNSNGYIFQDFSPEDALLIEQAGLCGILSNAYKNVLKKGYGLPRYRVTKDISHTKNELSKIGEIIEMIEFD